MGNFRDYVATIISKIQGIRFWYSHLTTTWTEFCHFLTPQCVDSYYTLRVDKNRHFCFPPPPLSCPRSYSMSFWHSRIIEYSKIFFSIAHSKYCIYFVVLRRKLVFVSQCTFTTQVSPDLKKIAPLLKNVRSFSTGTGIYGHLV